MDASKYTGWYRAQLVAQSSELPVVFQPGREVAVSVNGFWARIHGGAYSCYAIHLDEARRCLRTLRDGDGRPVPAEPQGEIEVNWTSYYSM